MDFFEVVKQRYSHKDGFLPDAVPLEDLERIAEAGLAAPSGNNSQCVRLVILPNRNALQPLRDIAGAIGLKTAPAAIAVLTDSAAQTGNMDFAVEDYAAAAENMLLAATALGYASLWLDSPFFYKDAQKGALAALGAPESCHLRVLLPIGKPDGEGSRREKMPFEKRVSYMRYGRAKITP